MMKEYKSHIDFVSRWSFFKTGFYKDRDVKHINDIIEEGKYIESLKIEFHPFFSFDDITTNGQSIQFGLEICLDHSNQLIKEKGTSVTIQLVPSAGMSLQKKSLSLKGAKSYAFNCDGLTKDNQDFGGHTHILNDNESIILKYNYGCSSPAIGSYEKVDDRSTISIISNTSVEGKYVYANDLWSNGLGVSGAGHVRVLPPLPLV